MIRQFWTLLLSGKSGILLVCLFLSVLYSCNPGKKLAHTPVDNRVTEYVDSTQKVVLDTEEAENIFVDAIKARILGNTGESFDKYSLLASAGNLGATPHYELSRIWTERNNIPRALKEIKIAVSKDSVNKWFQIQLADLLAYDGQYTNAAAVYHKLADKDRHPEEYLIREAMLYKKAEKYKDALEVINRLSILLGEDDESVLMERQQLYLNLNDVEGAAEEVKKLIRFYPYEAKYMILLADIYQNNGIDDKADKAFQNLEDKFPDDMSAQFALIEYNLKQKDTLNLRKNLAKIIGNKEISVQDRIKLIMPFVYLQGTDSSGNRIAFELAGQLVRQEPGQVDALLFYSDLLTINGYTDSAKQQLKTALSVDSSRFAIWQQLLLIALNQSDTTALITYSTEAVKIFPGEAMAHYFGGLGYMLSNENGKAIEFFNNAIRNYKEGNDDNLLAEMLVALGDVYNVSKQYASSDSCYQAALNLDPENAVALNNFSYYLSERGERLEEAAAMSAKSLKLRPDEATFLDTYGWILYKQGKYNEAREYIQRALDNSKESADATLWEHLGDIEFKLGNIEQAIEHWKMARQRGVSSESLQQKINQQELND